TNFIAEEYPDGFHAADVPQSDPMIPVAITATVHVRMLERARQISGQTRRFEPKASHNWVVIANKTHYPVTIDTVEHGYEVHHDDRIYRVQTDWKFGQARVEAVVNGHPTTVQVDRKGAGYLVFFRGAETEIKVMSPRTAALNSHLLEKVPPDLSKFLLSPMPGLLVRLSVAEGDEVKAGEELAVVEAMKMENSLRAESDGVVSKLLVEQGDSLTVDQPILEFG
ncbi:MAG: biotin/lipoyl-containing protein, partial [Pseudomonadales bacterium]